MHGKYEAFTLPPNTQTIKFERRFDQFQQVLDIHFGSYALLKTFITGLYGFHITCSILGLHEEPQTAYSVR